MQTAFLTAFLTIAELGSFSKAAQKLHISQPTLTQQMQTLEKELGFLLFTRRQRSIVELTPAAKQLAPELKRILGQLDDAVARARGQEEIVRVASIIYDSSILPMSMYEYIRSELPSIRLELQIEEKDVVAPLHRGSADMSVAGDCFPLENDRYEFVPLGYTSYICVMNPRHPLAEREKISVEEMVQYPVAFSVPEYSVSYNAHVEQIRRQYPYLREKPNYTYILSVDFAAADTIYLSVASAAPFFHGMACVPLAEQWQMPYVILYLRDCRPAVRRVADCIRKMQK